MTTSNAAPLRQDELATPSTSRQSRSAPRDDDPSLAGFRSWKAGRPAGSVTLPRTTAVSSVSERPHVSPEPLDDELAALQLGALVVSDLLQEGDGRPPGWEELPELLETKLSKNARKAYGIGLSRRRILDAAAAATQYLRFCVPADLEWAGPDVTDALPRLPRQHHSPSAAAVGARLAWAGPDGEGLLLDRFSHSYRRDVVLSDWMRAQVDADLQLGRALAGPLFAGVRVVCGLSLFISVHIPGSGEVEHALGGCASCTFTGRLL